MMEKNRMEETPVFGLDIGTRSIVGTVGYKQGEHFVVIAQEIREHQTRAMLDGQIHDINRVAATIAEVKQAIVELNAKIEATTAGVNCRIDGAYAQLNQQAVMNATITANLGCMAQQIAQLQGLTKLVVPNTSVCPGWGNVTITPSTTPATV